MGVKRGSKRKRVGQTNKPKSLPSKPKPSTDEGVYRGHKTIKRANRGGGNTTPGGPEMGTEAKNNYTQGQ